MLLALDTSTLTLSLALLEGEPGGELRVLEHWAEGPPRKQSQMLPGVIHELLERHRASLPQLSAIAVGLGPGSFTGLRIGLATAKALSYAAQVPLVGVPSLQAAALEGPEGVPLRPVAVVRQGELYVGHYRRRGGQVERLSPEEAWEPERLAEALRQAPGAVALGPAVAEYRARLLAAGAPEAALLEVASYPSAVSVARLAALPASFDLQALFAIEPLYIRGSGAERNPKFPPLPGPEPIARIRED